MEKIMRSAFQRDIEPMKRLWTECFPKDTEYAEFFFERVFRLSCAHVCEADGEICAMLHSFPYDFSSPEGEMHAKYIYGVGTEKKHRGKGLAGELLEREAENCDFTVIIPQSESLFNFYEKHGFTELFTVKRVSLAGIQPPKLVKAEVADVERLNEMYEKMCAGSIHPVRSPERWETLLAEHLFLGGGISIFDGGYCVHFKNGERQEISELCAAAPESPFGYECRAVVPGPDTPIGAARLVSDRAKKLFAKGYDRYLNLMHN